MAVLQPLPSFGIQYSPAPRKTGRRSPIAVSVEKAFDYSANGARVPLRVKLENTTGSDKKATLQFHEGWNGNRRTSHTYPFFIPARESVHAVVYPLLSYNLVYEVKENHEGASPIPTDTEHRKMVAVIQEGAPADWHLLSESSYNAAVSSCDLMKWPADYRMYEGRPASSSRKKPTVLILTKPTAKPSANG